MVSGELIVVEDGEEWGRSRVVEGSEAACQAILGCMWVRMSIFTD